MHRLLSQKEQQLPITWKEKRKCLNCIPTLAFLGISITVLRISGTFSIYYQLSGVGITDFFFYDILYSAEGDTSITAALNTEMEKERR